MLLIWTDPTRPDHQQEHADAPAVLDKLLDRIDAAARTGTPLAVQLYAGHHYPEPAHWEGTRRIPADPGHSPQPELLITLGADTTPLYWTSPDGREYTSKGPASTHEPEFTYLYGGQESYAPAWSLIPAVQALDALREFHQTGGQQPRNTTWQQT
jgi:immunity protein Imm1 of predicted polymorphic toxin system